MKTIYKNNPADSYEIVEFESTDLNECLNHYRDTKEIEPLENAIDLVNDKIKKAINDLNHLIIGCRTSGFNNTANALCDIREKLER